MFIPALWFHNTLTLDPSISVNQFFKSLTMNHQFYHKKDLYGNKDLIPSEKSFEMIEKACQNLLVLPDNFSDFYLRKMMDQIQSHLKDNS